MVSVIASSVRKGNVIEKDGKLYVVLKAESFHPGKGTPVTTIDMRRISDGVKVSERYKTTESLEKAFIDERTYNYLYQDGEHFVFMDLVAGALLLLLAVEGGVHAHRDLGRLLLDRDHHRAGVGVEAHLPVVEADPVVKGQTASGSFKPAMLSNGVRTTVPTHIVPGTRVVVMTEDGSYVERAKD